MGYKWKPSKAKISEFISKMSIVDDFCKKNDITKTKNSDSYYFTIDGQRYRVSNHSVEASNRGAYDDLYGQVRELYHPEGRKDNVVYIHASKTRIIDIYNDLKAGYVLDGRGNRK